MTRSPTSLLRSILPLTPTSLTKRHVERRTLRVSPQTLYSVITDVDKYSSFLPLCTSSRVLRWSPCGNAFDAALTVGMAPPLFTETYVSRVTFNEQDFVVEAKSINSRKGLFDSLQSRWKLTPVGVGEAEGAINKDPSLLSHCGCVVDFEVELSVSDPIVKNVVDSVLETVAGRQVDAFRQRCEDMERGKS